MSHKIVTSDTGASQTVSKRANLKILLACGVVAGPLFVGIVALQALTRNGFDLSRHPISLLGQGDVGWIQIANFVMAGLLSIAFAVGMWLLLHPGRAGT
jgi:hypothetical membrane protein